MEEENVELREEPIQSKEPEVTNDFNTQESVKEEIKIQTVSETQKGDFDIQASMKAILNAIKGVFTKPIDAIKEFVTDNNFIAGIIMIICAALTTGIYKLAILKRSYDGISKYYKPEYLKEFFTTFGEHLLQYALLAIFGYLIISLIFKGKTTIKQMAAAVGISLSLVIISYLASSILVFIDAEVVTHIISYIHLFASIYTYLIMFIAVKEVGEIDKNKLFLSVACMFIAASIGMDIYSKLFK